MSQPAISKHVKVLEKSGLIARRSLAQQRLCKLQTKPDGGRDGLDRNTNASFSATDKLENYLKEIQKKGKKHDLSEKAKSFRLRTGKLS